MHKSFNSSSVFSDLKYSAINNTVYFVPWFGMPQRFEGFVKRHVNVLRPGLSIYIARFMQVLSTRRSMESVGNTMDVGRRLSSMLEEQLRDIAAEPDRELRESSLSRSHLYCTTTRIPYPLPLHTHEMSQDEEDVKPKLNLTINYEGQSERPSRPVWLIGGH